MMALVSQLATLFKFMVGSFYFYLISKWPTILAPQQICVFFRKLAPEVADYLAAISYGVARIAPINKIYFSSHQSVDTNDLWDALHVAVWNINNPLRPNITMHEFGSSWMQHGFPLVNVTFDPRQQSAVLNQVQGKFGVDSNYENLD